MVGTGGAVMLRQKSLPLQKRNVSGVVRQIILSWLFSVMLEYLRLPGALRDLARLDGQVSLVQKQYVDQMLHGAGDVFTSALCGELLSGRYLQTALLHAADFCDSCIQETVRRQPGHWYGLAFEPVLKGKSHE